MLEVQYEQVDVADTGFTMSTNTVYSTIKKVHKNVAYGTSIGLNDVSV